MGLGVLPNSFYDNTNMPSRDHMLFHFSFFFINFSNEKDIFHNQLGSIIRLCTYDPSIHLFAGDFYTGPPTKFNSLIVNGQENLAQA